MWIGDHGLLSPASFFHSLPFHHEQLAERVASVLQICLIAVFAILHVDVIVSLPVGPSLYAVSVLLCVMVASALARWWISLKNDMRDLALDALNVLDSWLFGLLILAVFSKSQPVAISTTSVALWLALLVSIRLVRIHPRSILVSGASAILFLVSGRITNLVAGGANADYTFEPATAIVLTLLVLVSVFATWQARKTLTYLNTTMENMPHGVALFDTLNRLIVSNSQYSRLYGLTDAHRKRGTNITELIRFRHEAGCFGEVEYNAHETDWMQSFDASEPSIQHLADGRVFSILRQREGAGRIVTTTEDVTLRRKLEARVEHLAYHDALTNLANRSTLKQHLDRLAVRNGAARKATAFCMDLDRFKEINDTLGHEIGDALLAGVGERLKTCTKEGDLVARTGGDEFVIIQSGAPDRDVVAEYAQAVIDCLTQPYQLHGYQVQIGVSIGIAFLDETHSETKNLIKNADIALYKAKEFGRSEYCFYEDSMGRHLQERRKVEKELRTALENNEFELHYQPVLNTKSGAIDSMEALIRWQHPERGLVAPIDFLPIVDEIGMAIPVGEWVIFQACRDAAKLSDTIKVSVNVSAAQFQRAGLADAVSGALQSSRLPAHRLEIEITESVLLENTETTIATLKQLHELGVRIALDDFGTRYSSLSYLQKFSFDRLKIDRSFVRDSLTDESSSAIITSVIELGKKLGMKVTAEGVETQEQLVRVTEDGCTAIQGFLISRPLPVTELDSFLLANKNLGAALDKQIAQQNSLLNKKLA